MSEHKQDPQDPQGRGQEQSHTLQAAAIGSSSLGGNPVGGNPAPDLVFLDLEATSLRNRSHPLSAGLAWCDGRSELRLIRPPAIWAHIEWDPKSSEIHGLTLEQVVTKGTLVTDVARWLNTHCGGRTVVSDAPAFDLHWLNVLFSAAGVEPAFGLVDQQEALLKGMLAAAGGSMARADVLRIYAQASREMELRYPHTHRADEDALQMAMVHRAAIEGAALLEGEELPGVADNP